MLKSETIDEQHEPFTLLATLQAEKYANKLLIIWKLPALIIDEK